MKLKCFCLAAATAVAFTAAPAGAPAQERTMGIAGDLFTPEVKKAVAQGLDWLAARQNPNGSWNCKIGYKLFEDYHGEDGQDVGVTALCGMAYMGAGQVPNRGKHGRVVARALDFVLSCVREEDGYITSNGTRMYSHAFATMFLAEVYGTTPRADLRVKLKRAVNLIVSAQNHEGGWRYQPIPVDADLSVTVSTLQALRAARNTGIAVPMETINRATAYVKRCARSSGFSYQAATDYTMNDTRVSYPLSACGVVALYSAGEYDSREIRSGLAYLSRSSRLRAGRYHYFYGHYYASQAMYLSELKHQGGFRDYYTRVRDEILERRDKDGGWTDDVGRTYATAMAIIVLQMPCELLPLFQK
ncbi:MAG TPA: prenyltransferase/squalene oxidase repeat-containing protein [Planctomycetota bacterium]|nr:prenyltransferase/squalene oxidase repeat-containing protein [Planctomycetota bacterium]